MEKRRKKSLRVKIISFLLVFVLACGTGITGFCEEAWAATSVYAPNKVQCGVGMRHSSSININLVASTDIVKNIKVYSGSKGKSKTSNLVVKKTYQYKSSYSPYAVLTFYAKKAGTYRIKFDVYKSAKSKRTSRTVLVYAKGYGTTISKVTLNGSNVVKNYMDTSSCYTTKKSAKVKFTLSKGKKIKSITVTRLDQNGNEKTTKFKNGKKIAFGKYGSSLDTSYSWQRGMYAYTKFTITYTDQYAQNTTTKYTTTYYIYQKATKWY